MSLNRSGIPKQDTGRTVLWIVLMLAIAAAAILGSCYAPCELWRGSSLMNVPARCIPELVKP